MQQSCAVMVGHLAKPPELPVCAEVQVPTKTLELDMSLVLCLMHAMYNLTGGLKLWLKLTCTWERDQTSRHALILECSKTPESSHILHKGAWL